MHFSKTYTQLLLTLPPDLRDSAIEYRKLKKLIHHIVGELESIGLSPPALHHFLEQDRSMPSGEINPRATGAPSANIRPKVVYELSPQVGKIEPQLQLSRIPRSDASHGARTCVTGVSAKRAKQAAHFRRFEVSLERTKLPEVSVLIPTWYLPVRRTKFILHSYETFEGSQAQQVTVPLVYDGAFYQLLSSALQSFSRRMQIVQVDFVAALHELAQTISQTARPLSSSSAFHHPYSQASDPGGVRSPHAFLGFVFKSDLYAWREIFQIYVESEIFESVTESARGERSVEDSEVRLTAFVDRVTSRGLGSRRTLKMKGSHVALKSFLSLNVLLLNLKKLHRANAEATRKILKKHAKRTSLPLPTLVYPQSDPSIVSLPYRRVETTTLVIPSQVAPLPRQLVQAIGEILLPIIPHVDDYACLICTSIAFKPIRLSCGHLFCVRCLVKMQKRGDGKCPMCRSPTVLQADRFNVDWALLNFMQDWFPEESRQKLQSNEHESAKEQLAELGLPSQGCVIS
ncbi:hypothetical protein BC834DRAFT_980881 [Gloeopeniophorella convolvens]|nr:hypothetical protein BC834DRAFT_980881 [Gloeopeniophorella convolvens]